MSDLTKKDKLSILMRLVKRVKDWRFQKSLPEALTFDKHFVQAGFTKLPK